jgi:hypothetical protein
MKQRVQRTYLLPARARALVKMAQLLDVKMAQLLVVKMAQLLGVKLARLLPVMLHSEDQSPKLLTLFV